MRIGFHRPQRAVSLWTTVLIALSTMSCSSAAANPGELGATPEEGGSPDEIVASEIRAVETSYQSLRNVIQHLRPQWLRTRPSRSFANTTPTQPVVYLDRSRVGNLNSLYQIESSTVANITYLSGLDATTRYGTGHGGGVIEVYTR